jgi:hypothetical protein
MSQTEKIHAEEFLISEANRFRSRENMTIKSGENLKAGQVVRENTGLVAYDDDAQTAVGILLQPVDASDGAKKGAVLVRDAEVDGDLLDWSTSDGTAITAGIADLKSLGIIVR